MNPQKKQPKKSAILTILQRFLACCLLCALPMIGIERKTVATPLKISVIIPCHPAHFLMLEPLFIAFQNQTSLPDEIVVSLSEAGQVPQHAILSLEQKNWPFHVSILQVKEKQLPGKNRNCACMAAEGDVIVCQDADDLPHPQRIEAIRYLFENFEIEHLLHQWLESGGIFQPFEITGIENDCADYRSYPQISVPNIHNGSVVFLKKIFATVHWRPHLSIDEDTLFNRHATALFKKHYILPQPLIQYRGEFSTFDLNGEKGILTKKNQSDS